jgi:hypothetical protein
MSDREFQSRISDNRALKVVKSTRGGLTPVKARRVPSRMVWVNGTDSGAGDDSRTSLNRLPDQPNRRVRTLMHIGMGGGGAAKLLPKPPKGGRDPVRLVSLLRQSRH